MHEAQHSGDADCIAYDLNAEIALVVAPDGAAERAARHAAALAGYRARATIDPAAALTEPALLDGVHLLLVETEGTPDGLLAPVLARLGTVAEERGLPLIATVLPEQIDLAAGLLPAAAVLQCAPDPGDRLAAALFARTCGGATLHDSVNDEAVLRMRRFQEEVARIADSLARLTRGELPERPIGVRNDGFAFRGDFDPPEIASQEIRKVIRARRMRDEFFRGDLFADPAWDMLLDLFAADLEQAQVSVSSLCIAAAVPPTTALRWIGTLNEAGLFQRKADPNDRRRAYIALSDVAREGMLRFVGAVRRAGLGLV